jgi:capsular polysaccharide export protein
VQYKLPSSSLVKKVLVIDQTANDMSLQLGLVKPDAFTRMLKAAKEENPDAEIIIKTHPDVLAGKKRGHYSVDDAKGRVRIIADRVNPIDLLLQVDKIYTATSQMGFEALMANRPVVCFGAPFYAGWGLTDDRVLISRRKEKRTVEEIFAAAYILYSTYINPDTRIRGQIEDVIEHLALQRHYFKLNSGRLFCVGFGFWKHKYIRDYLKSPGNEIIFVRNATHLKRKNFNSECRLLVWGTKISDDIKKMAREKKVAPEIMEDGFLRSAGLGSDLTVPASLVHDSLGIYYDPSKTSDLEQMLKKTNFSSDQIKEAAQFIDDLLKLKISKYNVDGGERIKLPGDNRKIILVPGQVEDDASITLGCLDIKTNLDLLQQARKSNPDAFIIFKPHPDVISGNRKGAVPSELAEKLADAVLEDSSIAYCLSIANEVHTMTSLVGFEALMRKLTVVVYGRPFYAGWGLSIDRHPHPKRTRQLKIEELAYCALIKYPRYMNINTMTFTTPGYILQQLSRAKEQTSGSLKVKTWWHVRQLRKLKNIWKGLN